jgi:hypothetical protein
MVKVARQALHLKVNNPILYVVDQPVETAAEAKQMAQALCNELGGEFVCADAKAEGNLKFVLAELLSLKKWEAL